MSYVLYQPGGQVAGMPPQSTFIPDMGQPPLYYQSVTPIAQPYPPGTHRQGQPSYQADNQCQPSTLQGNQCKTPILKDTRHVDKRIAGLQVA